MDNLTNLQILNLQSNEIKELKGMENLKNLLRLYLLHNKIKVLKGLEHLASLHKIDLSGNSITDDEKHLVGIGLKNAQEIVRYCQEKASKAK